MNQFKPYNYPSNAIHISLDLETASLEVNAAIVQIGATVIASSSHDSISLPNYTCYMSVLEAERTGRDVSKSTMDWWATQDPALRKKVFGGTLSMQEGCDGFIAWCNYVSRDQLDRIVLWAKPAQFDLPILKSAVESYREWPFHYRNTGCAATMIRLMTPALQGEIHNAVQADRQLEAHNALHDAIYQAAFVKAVL